MKWSHKELHDALLSAGVAVPLVPSMPNYVAALHAQYGDADTGFMPQSFHSHSKAKLREILKILSRNGAKLSGKLSETKAVLAERLAHWLNLVLDAGRKGQGDSSDEGGVDGKDFDERPREQKTVLVEHAGTVGEIPQNALVTAEQAESALGRTVATELDVDISEAIDADTKEEEEALAGRQINPSGVDYSCLSWQPAAPDSVSAKAIGWEVDRAARAALTFLVRPRASRTSSTRL